MSVVCLCMVGGYKRGRWRCKFPGLSLYWKNRVRANAVTVI